MQFKAMSRTKKGMGAAGSIFILIAAPLLAASLLAISGLAYGWRLGHRSYGKYHQGS